VGRKRITSSHQLVRKNLGGELQILKTEKNQKGERVIGKKKKNQHLEDVCRHEGGFLLEPGGGVRGQGWRRGVWSEGGRLKKGGTNGKSGVRPCG